MFAAKVPEHVDGGDRNWYLAIGCAMTNTTGVVTAVPGPDGKPQVSRVTPTYAATLPTPPMGWVSSWVICQSWVSRLLT